MSPHARRRQFIDLGVGLAQEQPLETITIDAVAEAAGVSKGLLFHYFESKADFHLAVVREQADEMLARTAPRDDLDDPLATLHASVGAYVDYVAHNGKGFVGVIRGSASADEDIRAVADATRAAMSERILDHGAALGIERSPVIEMTIGGWMAYIEELLVRWLSDPVVERDELVELMVAALPMLTGLVDD